MKIAKEETQLAEWFAAIYLELLDLCPESDFRYESLSESDKVN